METQRYRSRRSAGQDVNKDHWLVQAGFGLFMAGLMVWLLALYSGVPVDF